MSNGSLTRQPVYHRVGSCVRSDSVSDPWLLGSVENYAGAIRIETLLIAPISPYIVVFVVPIRRKHWNYPP